MLEPTYRAALNHAWRLTWHHKLIWVLGLISVFLGQFGLSNFLGQFLTKAFTDQAWWPASWGVLHVAWGEQLFWFVWAALIVIGISLFILVAAVCAEGALIAVALHWYTTRTMLSVSKAWASATKHFWAILGINLLEKLCLSALLAAVLMSLDNLSGTSGLGFVSEVILVAVALFLALLISATSIYALGFCVAENRPIVEAVGRGWRLLDRHLLVTLEVSAILLLYNFVVIAAISLASFIVLIPSFFVTVATGLTGYTNLLSVSVALYMFLLVAFIMVVGGAFNAFTITTWMYLFKKMHHEGVVSRITHHLARLVRR